MTVTKDQMKAIEKQANDRGLPYLQMMENAGTAAAATTAATDSCWPGSSERWAPRSC